jgi:hypothetical protein
MNLTRTDESALTGANAGPAGTARKRLKIANFQEQKRRAARQKTLHPANSAGLLLRDRIASL